MKTIAELQQQAHENSRSKGFWDEAKRGDGTLIPGLVHQQIPTKLCLVHSELSEALEEYRNDRPYSYAGEKGKPEGIASELADAVIQILDLAAALRVDLADAIERKMAFNAARPHRHGGKVV